MAITLERSRLVFEKVERNLLKLASELKPESVHGFRTSARRLQTLLEELKSERNGNEKKLLKLLSRIRKRAGKVRDLDVQVSTLRSLKIPQEPRRKTQLLQNLIELRAEREKKPERVLVFKRALASVFIASLESGRDALDKKDFRRAESYFACASEANPESEWSFRNLAIARASSGDGKGALEALRSAHKLSKDLSAFSDWLTQEPAFVLLQSTSEYRVLREPL